jgi:hypothetical protein
MAVPRRPPTFFLIPPPLGLKVAGRVDLTALMDSMMLICFSSPMSTAGAGGVGVSDYG